MEHLFSLVEPASRRAVDRAGAPQLPHVRKERRFLAAVPVAVEPAARADDCFGAAVANDEGLAAAPAGLGTAVGEVGCDLFHGTAPMRHESDYGCPLSVHPSDARPTHPYLGLV